MGAPKYGNSGTRHNPFIFIGKNFEVMVTVTVFPPGGNFEVMVTVTEIVHCTLEAVLFEAWSLRVIRSAVYSKTPNPECWLDLLFFGRNNSCRLDEIKLWEILFQECIAFRFAIWAWASLGLPPYWLYSDSTTFMPLVTLPKGENPCLSRLELSPKLINS